MSEKPLNRYLCCALYALFILGNCTIFLPLNQGVSASPFGLLLAFSICLFITPLTFKFLNKENFTNNIFGIFLSVIFFIFALLTATDTVTDFSLVSNAEILTNKNSLIFSLVFSILVFLILKAKKEVIFKMSLIFLALIIFSEIVLFFMSSNQFVLSNIKSLSLEGIFSQFLYFLAKSFAPVILLPFFLCQEKSKGTYLGIFTAFFLILLPLAQILLIFGTDYTKTLEFPFITVLDTVSIGLKYSRLEGLAFIIFFFGALIKCSVALYCAKEVLQKLFKKSERFLPLCLTIFLFFISLFGEKIATKNSALSLIIVSCATILLVVALLKSRTHCQCKTT